MRPCDQEIIVIEDDSSDTTKDDGSDDGSLGEEIMRTTLALQEIDEAALDITHSPFDNAFNFDQPLRPSTITIDPKTRYRLYLDKVLEVFPDISLDHARSLYDTSQQQPLHSPDDDVSQAIITQILDTGKYPKEKDKKKDTKRKRTTGSGSDEDDSEWTSPDRSTGWPLYSGHVNRILQKEFVKIPQRFLEEKLKEHRFLFPTYMAVELAERTYHETRDPPYQKLKASRKPRLPAYLLPEPAANGSMELDRELRAAKKERAKQEGQRRKKQDAIDADLALEKECLERGDMVECQCCFTDTPTPKSTYCDGDDTHLFCFDCARSNAKSQIELSRYKLSCMDGSGCKAEFAKQQRERFLDAKMIALLDRLQQQADLRTAGLINLENCPFCDYAAICPPVEIDKEFRCCMPGCERVSCRLCKLDSHIPLTCEEYRKENGLNERHALEEAMTQALVRRCPKCNVPILKDGGCNKLVCTQCRCYVCDYCGKDITKSGYSHFSGNAGPGQGCPSTDDSVLRNATRVDEAEKAAMAKIRAENPSLSEDDLKIKFSKEVQAMPSHSHPPVNNVNRLRNDMGLPLPRLPPGRPLIEVPQNQDEILARRVLALRRVRDARRMHDETVHKQAGDGLDLMRRSGTQRGLTQLTQAIADYNNGIYRGHQRPRAPNRTPNNPTDHLNTPNALPANPIINHRHAVRTAEPVHPPVLSPSAPFDRGLGQSRPGRWGGMNGMNPTNQMNLTNQMNQLNQTNYLNPLNPTNQLNPVNPLNPNQHMWNAWSQDPPIAPTPSIPHQSVAEGQHGNFMNQPWTDMDMRYLPPWSPPMENQQPRW